MAKRVAVRFPGNADCTIATFTDRDEAIRWIEAGSGFHVAVRDAVTRCQQCVELLEIYQDDSPPAAPPMSALHAAAIKHVDALAARRDVRDRYRAACKEMDEAIRTCEAARKELMDLAFNDPDETL